jgi:hypothetical protein
MFRWTTTGTRLLLLAHCVAAQHARAQRNRPTEDSGQAFDDDEDETSSVWGPIGAGIAFALLFVGVVIVRCNKEGPRKDEPPPEPKPKLQMQAPMPGQPRPVPLIKYKLDKDVELGEAVTPEAVTFESSR